MRQSLGGGSSSRGRMSHAGVKHMPGIATQFVVLDRVIDKLAASSDANARHAADVMRAQPAFAALGAIGPALVDFLPSDPPAGAGPATPQAPYASLWTQVLAIAGGDGTPADPGALYVINEFKRLLDKLDQITGDEDLGALQDLQDSGDVAIIETLAQQLKTIVDSLLPRVAAIGAAITSGMRPAVNVDVGNPVPGAEVWTAREWLHWKHPGRFATALVKHALDSGDERFQAYAYGYLSCVATDVGFAPFMNSVVGSSYRQQWWRTRWVGNYTDAWVHGVYRTPATLAGDTLTPGYANLVPLCRAKLQDRITLVPLDPVDVMNNLRQGNPFPAALPADFADYWMASWQDAYGPPPLGSRFRKAALNGAYCMTWMKLWFQTSGDVIGCQPPPAGAPPGDCGPAPSWVDPNVPGDPGDGSGPAVPEPESDPDVGEIVTGVILALLGLASLFFGGGAAGAAAIVGGVALVIDGATEINWAKLRCDLYWLRQYLNNGLRALHDLLTLGAFTPPYPSELAQDSTTIQLLGIPYTFDSGKRLAKSRAVYPEKLVGQVEARRTGSFPAKRWDGALGTWVQQPGGVEQPETTGYLRVAYPPFALDDAAANPLTADNDVRTGAAWPPGERRVPGTDVPVTFANAVDNAIDLILHAGDPIPDWNLDADRGLAWLTFELTSPLSDPVNVQAEP